MIKIINYKDLKDDFFNGRDFGSSIDIVKDILLNVKTNGDKALLEYGTKFDVSAPSSLEIPQSELKAAAQKMQKENPELYKSLCYSHDLALRFAKKQRESFDNFEVELEPGLFTGQKNIPVEKAGVYVPAGRFPLVSTVVMTVTPAVAAGVKEIILCTPPRVHPDDRVAVQKAGTGIPGSPFVGGKPYADENIMAAAYICGVTKAYACGGAQAIGALAFGTQSIPRTDVIRRSRKQICCRSKKTGLRNCRNRHGCRSDRSFYNCRQIGKSRMGCGRPSCAGRTRHCCTANSGNRLKRTCTGSSNRNRKTA